MQAPSYWTRDRVVAVVATLAYVRGRGTEARVVELAWAAKVYAGIFSCTFRLLQRVTANERSWPSSLKCHHRRLFIVIILIMIISINIIAFMDGRGGGSDEARVEEELRSDGSSTIMSHNGGGIILRSSPSFISSLSS